jgi:hypothetical protein
VVVPFGIAYDLGPLFFEQRIDTVKAVEDEGSGLWVVTEEKGKGLAVKRMIEKNMQQMGPLSTLARRSPGGDAEYEIVNIVEDCLRHLTSTGGLCAKMVGYMLGACLSQLVLMLVDYYR